MRDILRTFAADEIEHEVYVYNEERNRKGGHSTLICCSITRL